jgi:hypothetical protein
MRMSRVKDQVVRSKRLLVLNRGGQLSHPRDVENGFNSQRGGTSFDFLGFTLYWGRSLNGHSIPRVKTSGKRIRASLTRVQAWASTVRSRQGLLPVWRTFCAKVRGHLRYYGVSFNHRALDRFITQATRIMYKWLNRRSQRRSFTWTKFQRFMDQYSLPRPVVYTFLFDR